MSDLQSLELVHRLWNRTRDGHLKWEQGTAAREFRAELGGYRVIITEIDDPEYPETPDYHVRIHKQDGRWLETISNASLRPFMDNVHDGMNPYGVMAALYRHAHRSSLGVDQAVREIVDLLGEPGDQ